MKHQTIRKQLSDTVIKATESGLIRLSAGNLSARINETLIAITPSGIQYHAMQPADIAIIDLEGNLHDGLPPSSETPLHTALYKTFPKIGGICHTHSPYAITFAMLEKEIPAVNLELAACGAPIPITRWAGPGTPEVGTAAVEAYQNRPELRVILLKQHGLVATGQHIGHAFEMAYNAEIGLQTYHQALLIGSPQPLSPAQRAEIYGNA